MTDDGRIAAALRERFDAIGNEIPPAPPFQPPDERTATTHRASAPGIRARSSRSPGLALLLLVALGLSGLAIATRPGLSPLSPAGSAEPSSAVESSGPPALTQLVALPTWPEPQDSPPVCPQAHRGGVTLRGDADRKDMPVWLETRDGKALTVIWPHGFTARFAPQLELVNGRGDVVAREGQVLDLGGGVVPGYDFYACLVRISTQ